MWDSASAGIAAMTVSRLPVGLIPVGRRVGEDSADRYQEVAEAYFRDHCSEENVLELMEILTTEWDTDFISDSDVMLAALGVMGRYRARHGISWEGM
jgi:hypothetical protein